MDPARVATLEVEVRELRTDKDDHELRIRALERSYWKLIGACAAAAAAGAGLPHVLSLFGG